MKIKTLVSKYIENTEQVFKAMKIVEQNTMHITEDRIQEVIAYAEHYLRDAKYYRDRNEFETGLASVAYCEGLLDALKLLRMVDFSWPTKQEK